MTCSATTTAGSVHTCELSTRRSPQSTDPTPSRRGWTAARPRPSCTSLDLTSAKLVPLAVDGVECCLQVVGEIFGGGDVVFVGEPAARRRARRVRRAGRRNRLATKPARWCGTTPTPTYGRQVVRAQLGCVVLQRERNKSGEATRPPTGWRVGLGCTPARRQAPRSDHVKLGSETVLIDTPWSRSRVQLDTSGVRREGWHARAGSLSVTSAS